MAELSASTESQIITELLSRTPTVNLHTQVFAVVTITLPNVLLYERDIVAAVGFNAAITGRRQADVLHLARETIEKL